MAGAPSAGRAEVNGLLSRVPPLREMLQGDQRLLKVPHNLPVGRTHLCLHPCLPAVGHGLLPHLPPQGMVGQAFDLLGQTVPASARGLDDAGMEHAPSLLEQTP